MSAKERLEYLRGEIDAERISMGEVIELQGLAEHIEPGDVQLLEWAGVPEFPESEETESVNPYTIFIASYEIPESHGSHDFSFSEDAAREMYNKYVENAESGQITRLYSLDIRQLVNDSLDEILWMRTVSEEDAGLVSLQNHEAI